MREVPPLANLARPGRRRDPLRREHQRRPRLDKLEDVERCQGRGCLAQPHPRPHCDARPVAQMVDDGALVRAELEGLHGRTSMNARITSAASGATIAFP